MADHRLGLIVPLAEEFGYVREALDLRGDFVVDDRRYFRFRIGGSRINGIGTVIHKAGEGYAAAATRSLIEHSGASMIAVVGCAGALDSDLRVGDVAVASEVHSYASTAKAVPASDDGFNLDTGFSAWRVRSTLTDFVDGFAQFESSRGRFARWQEAAVPRAPAATMPPAILVGPVASGMVVSAAGGFVQQLRTANRKLLAIETESGGVAAVAERHDVDLLVVRGISDYSDGRKSDLDRAEDGDGRSGAWRRYAVRNAADLLVELVSAPDFPWLPRHSSNRSLFVLAPMPLLVRPPTPPADPDGTEEAASTASEMAAGHETAAEHPAKTHTLDPYHSRRRHRRTRHGHDLSGHDDHDNDDDQDSTDDADPDGDDDSDEVDW